MSSAAPSPCTRRTDDDLRVGIAALEHRQDVADRRAVERGDDPDAAGQERQRPLARLLEEAFRGCRRVRQLLERELQRAQAARLERTRR